MREPKAAALVRLFGQRMAGLDLQNGAWRWAHGTRPVAVILGGRHLNKDNDLWPDVRVVWAAEKGGGTSLAEGAAQGCVKLRPALTALARSHFGVEVYKRLVIPIAQRAHLMRSPADALPHGKRGEANDIAQRTA